MLSWLLFRSILRLGIIHGPLVFQKMVFNKAQQNYVEFTLPNYANKIYARPKTSDIEVFETVFIASRFDIKFRNIAPNLIIDAGANIGYVSVFFANKYPSAIIYAIEPETSNYDILLQNIAGYENIRPIKAALWKDNTPLSIENPEDDKWAFRVSADQDQQKSSIESITVADILALNERSYIDIFKIDIEGAEKDLFETNYRSWVSKVGLYIIEFHDGFRDGCENTFYSAINSLQYTSYRLGENHFILMG